MQEIRQSGSVRGVRRNPYPYRDSVRPRSQSDIVELRSPYTMDKCNLVANFRRCVYSHLRCKRPPKFQQCRLIRNIWHVRKYFTGEIVWAKKEGVDV